MGWIISTGCSGPNLRSYHGSLPPVIYTHRSSTCRFQIKPCHQGQYPIVVPLYLLSLTMQKFDYLYKSMFSYIIKPNANKHFPNFLICAPRRASQMCILYVNLRCALLLTSFHNSVFDVAVLTTHLFVLQHSPFRSFTTDVLVFSNK